MLLTPRVACRAQVVLFVLFGLRLLSLSVETVYWKCTSSLCTIVRQITLVFLFACFLLNSLVSILFLCGVNQILSFVIETKQYLIWELLFIRVFFFFFK